jgi:5-formyltetrahydrofolate cyclo-ligase
MTVQDLAGAKAQLRKSLNAWRSQFAVHLSEHPNEREQLQQQFAQPLSEFCAATKSSRIASYLPFGGEPDVSAFNAWALDAGIELLLPVANTDGSIYWVSFDGASTKESIFGFAEPHGEPTELEPVDLIIVPALAIDSAGNRLGKGKGYYDRALAQTNAVLVAVVYQHELLESLPTEQHDKSVQYVATPSNLAKLSDS